MRPSCSDDTGAHGYGNLIIILYLEPLPIICIFCCRRGLIYLHEESCSQAHGLDEACQSG